MRRLVVIALLICCTSAFAQKWTREKGRPPQPATELYFGRVGTIILKALAPEWAKHLERLSGKLRVSLFIDRQGHIQSPKIVSSTSNRWVQDTALRVVRTVNLPPMPKQVIVEQGHEPVHFEIEWGPFERHD
jgi:TonB family protein